MTETTSAIPAAIATSGKHVTFALDGEQYGVPILSVIEIMRVVDVTSIPNVPAWVRGVINLRGDVVPVIDLRSRFGLASADDTEETCFLVVKAPATIDAEATGLVIDRVVEVIDVGPEDIEPPPRFGQTADTDFIRGVARNGDSLTILVDVESIVAGSDDIVAGSTDS